MQTFLPYADFARSARCLDSKRLGKQRVEAWQIYKALTRKNYGWQSHPAVCMWRGHLSSLLRYGIAICQEWRRRDFKDRMLPKFQRALSRLQKSPGRGQKPAFLGNPEFHASHRANLLRKNPGHYSRFRWKESPSLPYVWPVRKA